MHRARTKVLLTTIPPLLICLAWGCAHAHPPSRGAAVVLATSTTSPTPETGASTQPDTPAAATPREPTPAERLQALRRLVEEELDNPKLGRTRVSLLVGRAAGGDPLISVSPDERRVPASNAKLFTSTAAALTLGRYSFSTEISRVGTRLYLWSSGDPVLQGRHLDRLARQLKARGVTRVRHIVVDDSHFNRKRLAPGFNKFGEGAYYRPTSGALNVDGNVVVIKVSAPEGRRRPRVDVTPPSDYVKVRKLVAFERRSRRRGKRARGRRGAGKPKIKVQIRPRGAIMWVTVSGTVPRKMRRPWYTRRAVYDPGLNAGWALRRSLVKAGVKVEGIVSRGRRPRGVRPLVRTSRSLGAILAAVNRNSDNLAAETLVRAMGAAPAPEQRSKRGSWSVGLARMRAALSKIGVTSFSLGNGSGLHRRSWVTASALVQLLQKVYAHKALRARILPTLAVAGRSGTLGRRLRGTAAEGRLLAKTGTLAGVLALSGVVAPGSKNTLVFSLLLNGRSDRVARAVIDRVAVHLARYAAGLPMDPDEATTRPATQPASAPTSAPATAPALDLPQTQPTPASQPASQPRPVQPAPASQPVVTPLAAS